jgi:hypothetical protein
MKCFFEIISIDSARVIPTNDDLVRELEGFVRTVPEDQIVRINPIRYAADRGRDEAQIIDLFLHGRKAGLLTMEWDYVCRGCEQIIASFDTLNAATADVAIARLEFDLAG